MTIARIEDWDGVSGEGAPNDGAVLNDEFDNIIDQVNINETNIGNNDTDLTALQTKTQYQSSVSGRTTFEQNVLEVVDTVGPNVIKDLILYNGSVSDANIVGGLRISADNTGKVIFQTVIPGEKTFSTVLEMYKPSDNKAALLKKLFASAGLDATTGDFSGLLSANAGLDATTGDFSGLLSADVGLSVNGDLRIDDASEYRTINLRVGAGLQNNGVTKIDGAGNYETINVKTGHVIDHNGVALFGYTNDETALYVKKIAVDDWDVGTAIGAHTRAVTHGLTDSKILGAWVQIRNDLQTEFLRAFLTQDEFNIIRTGFVYNKTLSLKTTSTTQFTVTVENNLVPDIEWNNATSYTRGWVYALYTE